MNRASSNRLRIRLGAALALCLGIACNRQSNFPPPLDRIAIYPVENLTGRADLSGAPRALQVLLEYQLAGLTDVVPVLVNSPSEATGKRALHELRGYIETSGPQLRLKLQDRSPTGAINRIIEAQGTSLAALSTAIAHQVSDSARPLPAISEEAINAFAAGVANPGTPESIGPLTKATQLAPNFGPAWVQLGAALWNQHDVQQATQVWQQALASKLDAISQARIRTERATKAHIGEVAAAYVSLAQALPADVNAQAQAGNELFNAGQYAEAVRLMKSTVALEPTNGPFLNTLAYAQAMLGDYNPALANIALYQQLDPKDANVADSRGEIQFLSRHFTEAAKSFESVGGLNPNFQQGFARRKAAEAYLLAGDPASANRLMSTWAAALPPGAPETERFLAAWEHRIGKRNEAIERLLKLGPQDNISSTQAIIWLLQEGDRPRAAALAAKMQGTSSALLRFLTMPSAPAATWNQRAAAIPPPDARLALTYALALDNHWPELATLLAPDAPKFNPLQSAQMLALYRRALTEAKQTDALKSLPNFPVLPTAGPDSLFDSLIYIRQ